MSGFSTNIRYKSHDMRDQICYTILALNSMKRVPDRKKREQLNMMGASPDRMVRDVGEYICRRNIVPGKTDLKRFF